ncbi:LRR domain containing protein [Parasponia andersonii]|uniref:LRR domain containing protein n=1 Tax=Parasponia andersonii TaxID=3476 RepID=A0A2P5BTY5_PARAD|nr:LRR domain containing protein [Parasponia andersonii]
MSKTISLRRGVPTHRLYINWCLESSLNVNRGDEEEYRVLTWLHNAVLCEVKELELVLKPKSGSAFSLPPSLIGSRSLEYLKVENLVTCFTDGIVKFLSYSSIGYSSLKCLRLSHVRIDESFGNWVSTCCKFLENLSLSWIKEIKSLIIDSSCLQGLHISSRDLCHLQVSAEILGWFTLFWKCDSPSNRTFQLSTP